MRTHGNVYHGGEKLFLTLRFVLAAATAVAANGRVPSLRRRATYRQLRPFGPRRRIIFFFLPLSLLRPIPLCAVRSIYSYLTYIADVRAHYAAVEFFFFFIHFYSGPNFENIRILYMKPFSAYVYNNNYIYIYYYNI